MKKVYLIRHGMPDFPNGERMCLGATDIPMGEEGLAQAADMAANLPDVTAVFSSPLTRALQTARAIGKPVTILPGLQERYAGEWDGMYFKDIKLQYPALYAARGQDLTLPLPGEEDPTAGLTRFRQAMEEADRSSPGDFAVVSHGGIIAEFLQSLCGKRYKPGYVQVISLTCENGNFRLWEEENHA